MILGKPFAIPGWPCAPSSALDKSDLLKTHDEEATCVSLGGEVFLFLFLFGLYTR